MRNRPASVAVCTGLVAVALVGGIAMRARGQTGRAGACADRPDGYGGAARPVRAVADPVQDLGQMGPDRAGVKGTTNLITPEKVASAMRLAKDGIVVSLAHAEPQTVAADVGAPGIFHRVTNNISEAARPIITR